MGKLLVIIWALTIGWYLGTQESQAYQMCVDAGRQSNETCALYSH